MGSKTWGMKSGVTWWPHTWDHPPLFPPRSGRNAPLAAIAGLNLLVIDGRYQLSCWLNHTDHPLAESADEVVEL